MVNFYTQQGLVRMDQNVYPTKTPSENTSAFWGIERLMGMAMGYSGTFGVGGFVLQESWTTGSSQSYLYTLYPMICPALRPFAFFMQNCFYVSSNGYRFLFFSAKQDQTTYLGGNLNTYYYRDKFNPDSSFTNGTLTHGCFCCWFVHRFPASTTISTRSPKTYFQGINLAYSTTSTDYQSNINGCGFLGDASGFTENITGLYPPVGSSGPLGAGLINGLNKSCERLLKMPLVFMSICAPVTSGTYTPPTMGTSVVARGLRFLGYQSPGSPSQSSVFTEIPTYIPQNIYSIMRWIPYRQGCPIECNTIHVLFIVDAQLFYLQEEPEEWDLEIPVTVEISGAEITKEAYPLWSFSPSFSSATLHVYHVSFNPIMPDDKKITIGNRDFWPFRVKNIYINYLDDKDQPRTYTRCVQSLSAWIGGEIQ